MPKHEPTPWGKLLAGFLQAVLVMLAAKGVGSIDELNKNVATLLERTSNQGLAINKLEDRVKALEH